MTTGVARKSLRFIKDETQYYEHQANGIRKGARMSSFILADEPGLGKTLQALTIAAIDFELNIARRVLVVCPASLKYNWAEECDKYTRFQYIILEGSPDERKSLIRLFEVMELQILIVNYEQVRTHLKDLNALDFDIIIYDEAHYIKNHKSKRSQAALSLKGTRHIVVTGTPMLNQVHELWTLLHRIDPYRWPNYWPFVNRYCAFGGYRNKQIIGVKNRQELNLHLQEVMIRRLKKDVLDLPKNQYIQVPIELHPEQRKIYDQALSDLEVDLPDSPDPMELENALVKYLVLKQICGTLACLPGYDDTSAKLDRAVEMLEEFTHEEPDSPSEPVVVFTQFRTVSSCLAARLEKVGIKVYQLNGDTPKDKRVSMVEEWGNYKDPATGKRAVLICMLQIAVGLNMTAASKCIFVDKLYVPKLNGQAKDRLDRIGADLTKPIQIYELIARKTIEQRIESILKTKTKIFDSVVEESDWKRELYKALREKD